MFKVIFYHAAMAYAPLRPWAVKDPSAHATFDAVMWLIEGSALPTFFVLSGFFGAMLRDGSGLREHIVYRCNRIGVPMAVAAPSVYLYWWWISGERSELPLGHLWFLEYLLIVSIAIPLADQLARSRWPGPFDALRRAHAAVVGHPVAALWLGIPTALIILLPPTPYDPAMIGSATSLIPDPSILLYYTFFFVFGWLLYPNRDLLHTKIMATWPWLIGGGFLIRLLTAYPMTHPELPGRALMLVSLKAVYTWTMVLGFLGLSTRFIQKDRPVLRYVTDSAYWCYIVHMFPLLLLQLMIADLSSPPLLKFVVVLFGSLGLSLVTYEYFVRYSFIGAALNGPRQRPAGARSAAWVWSPLPSRAATSKSARDAASAEPHVQAASSGSGSRTG